MPGLIWSVSRPHSRRCWKIHSWTASLLKMVPAMPWPPVGYSVYFMVSERLSASASSWEYFTSTVGSSVAWWSQMGRRLKVGAESGPVQPAPATTAAKRFGSVTAKWQAPNPPIE